MAVRDYSGFQAIVNSVEKLRETVDREADKQLTIFRVIRDDQRLQLTALERMVEGLRSRSQTRNNFGFPDRLELKNIKLETRFVSLSARSVIVETKGGLSREKQQSKTDSQELAKALGSEIKKIKVGGGLGNPLQILGAGILLQFGFQIAKGFEQSFGKKTGFTFAKAGKFAGTSVTDPVQAIKNTIKARRKERLENESVKQAQEMAKTETVKVDPNKINVFAVGGAGGNAGRGSVNTAKNIKNFFGRDNVNVIPVNNPNSDPSSKPEDIYNFLLEQYNKYLQNYLIRGYNPDAVKLASKVIAAKKQDPTAKIQLIGESLGGTIVEEAIAILEKTGITDVKGIGTGTPDIGIGFDQKNYQGFLGKNDKVRKSLLLQFLAQSKNKNQNLENIGQIANLDNHYFKEYLFHPDVLKNLPEMVTPTALQSTFNNHIKTLLNSKQLASSLPKKAKNVLADTVLEEIALAKNIISEFNLEGLDDLIIAYNQLQASLALAFPEQYLKFKDTKNVAQVNYQKIAQQVGELSGVTPDKLPQLSNEIIQKEGVNAEIRNNKIYLSKKIADKLAKGEIDADVVETLIHEIRHGVQKYVKKLINTEELNSQATQGNLNQKAIPLLEYQAQGSVESIEKSLGRKLSAEETAKVLSEELDAYSFQFINARKVLKKIQKSAASLNKEIEKETKPNEPNQVSTRTDTPGRPDGSGNQPPDRTPDIVRVGPVELPPSASNNVDTQADPTRGGGLAPLAGQLDTYQKTLRESLARVLEAQKAQTEIEIEPGFWVDVEQLNQGFVKRTQTQLILFWEKLRTNLGKEINRTLAGLLGTIPGAMLGRGLTGDPVGGYLGGMAGRLIAETGFQDVSNFRSLQQQGMSPATAEFWQQFGNNRKFLPNTLRKTAVGYVTGSVVGRGINDVMQATGANQLIGALMPSWLETAIGDGINRTIKTIADPNIDLAIPHLPPAANKILSAPLHAVGKSVAAQGFLGNVATSFLDHQTKTALMPVREALTGAGHALGGKGLLGEYLSDRLTGLGIGAIQDTAKASGRGVAGMIAPGLPAEVRNFIADQVIKQGVLDGTVRDQVAPFLASRAGTDVFARGVKVPVTGKIAGTINQTLDKYDPFAIAPKQSLTDEQILLNREQRLAKKRTTAINAVENLFNRIDKSVDETTKAVVGIGNGFLGFFDNIRTKTYDFAKKTAGLTDNPVTLIDQYVVYLDQLVQDAQKQAEETIKGIIPDYKNLTIPERREAIGSYKADVVKEIKQFRKAIKEGDSQLALEIGENILALVESTRKIYKDLLEAVPSDLSGTKSIEANQRYLTSVQNEVLKGQPKKAGSAKTGLMQLVGTETSEGFIKGIEERLNKVRNSGKELAESAIEGAKKRLGIASPSKEFEKLGESSGQGYEIGIKKSLDSAKSAINKKIQEILNMDFYHGTSKAGAKSILEKGIDVDRVQDAVYGKGFYLTDKLGEAESYASEHRHPEVLKARLNVKNPFIVTEKGYQNFIKHAQKRGELIDPFSQEDPTGEKYQQYHRDKTKLLQKKGYDSIFVRDKGFAVAFEAEQVKLEESGKNASESMIALVKQLLNQVFDAEIEAIKAGIAKELKGIVKPSKLDKFLADSSSKALSNKGLDAVIYRLNNSFNLKPEHQKIVDKLALYGRTQKPSIIRMHGSDQKHKIGESVEFPSATSFTGKVDQVKKTGSLSYLKLQPGGSLYEVVNPRRGFDVPYDNSYTAPFAEEEETIASGKYKVVGKKQKTISVNYGEKDGIEKLKVTIYQLEEIRSEIDKSISLLSKPVAQLKSAFDNLGKDTIEGFVQGVQGNQSDAIEVIAELVNSVIEKAKDDLEIQSPSKKFRRMAQQSVAGFVQGLGEGEEEVKEAIGSFWDSLENIPILGWLVKAGRLIAKLIGDMFGSKKPSNQPKKQEPKELIDNSLYAKYVAYLDSLKTSSKQHTLKHIQSSPQYKEFKGLNREDQLKVTQQSFSEIKEQVKEFKEAVADGNKDLAFEVGETIVGATETLKLIYDDLIQEIEPDSDLAKQLEKEKKAVEKIQRQTIGNKRTKTGLTNLAREADRALEMGESVGDGFVQGIESKIGEAGIAAETLSEQVIKEAEKRLGIQSPSRVFEEIGQRVVEGFNLGVQAIQSAINTPIDQALTAVDNSFSAFIGNAQQGFNNFVAQLEQDFPIFAELKDLILGLAAGFALNNIFEFLVGQVTALGDASFGAVLELESMRLALTSVTGSAEAGAKGLAFVREEAQRLGVELKTAEEAYTGFLAVTKYTVLQGKQADRIFSVFQETAARRGLSNEEQGRMFAAINQAISKRKLSAEEVRGQLGEIPGLAFESTVARSMGINPAQLSEMMGDGLLMAEDVFPRVAALYEAENAKIAGGTETTTQALTRFQNAIVNLQRSFEGWIAPAKTFFNFFAAAIEKISEIIPIVVRYLGIFSAALFIDFAKISINLIKFLSSLKTVQVVLQGLAKVAVAAFKLLYKELLIFLGQFALLTLAVDAVGAAIYVLSNNAFPELKKGIEEATTRANQLEQALQNVGKATQAIPKELPKTKEEIVTTRNWNILGWDTGFNLEGTRQFLNNIDKAVGFEALGFEPALTTLGQQELANFQENVGGLVSQVDKNLSKQFDVEKTIKEIRELDKELTQARSRQFNIPAGDKKRYEAAIKEQQKLIEERDKKLSATASFEKALQGDKAEIEEYLKALDELVAKRGITEEAEKSIRAQLEQRLKDIDKTSTAFDDLMSNLQKSVNGLTLALRNLNEQASYFNETLQRNATNARVQFIRRARAAGVGSQVRDLGLDSIEQNTLEARIVFLRDQLGAVNKYLSKPDFADVLTDLRQQAEDMGVNLENTATIDRLISENRSQQETAVLNTLKEQLRLQDELGQAEENLEQSISSTRSGIRDLNNSVEEFFFNLTQRIDEAIVEVDRILNRLKYTDIKNRLQRALVPGSNTFVNGLVSQIQGIFDRASGIVEQLLGQRSARINFVGERRGLQVELENFTRNLGGATEALELFRQGLLGTQPSGGGGQPLASGRFAIGTVGSTGIGTGAHLDIRGKDRQGNRLPESRLRELLSLVVVGGKPLSEQLDKITSGYGHRRPPTRGASSFHPALDFGFSRGTPIEFIGQAVSARTFFDKGGGGKVIEITLPNGEKLQLLHLDSVADLGTIQRGRVNTPGNTTGNTPRQGMPNVPFASLIESAARQAGIDPLLFAALVRKESGFRQEKNPGQILTSPVGALGISQLMPGTAKELGVDPRNVIQNLIGGAKYLAKMLERFGGNIELALSAYKAGPGNVRNNQLARGTVQDVGIVMQYYREFQQQMAKSGAGQAATANQPTALAIPKQIQSVLVQEVGGKTVFSKNASIPPASPASTIKLIVADILSKEIKKGTIGLKDQITIKQPLVDPHGTLKSGNRKTVQELIDLMLRVSDNTATNVLIDLMGGLQSVTNKAQQSGYTATTLSRYLNIPGSGPANRSNAVDTTRAMQAILSDNSEAGQLAEKSIRQTRNFKFSGEVGGKIGNNSKVIGNVGIVSINGKEYIVTAYANVDGNVLSNRGIITNATNLITSSLSASPTPLSPIHISDPPRPY
ncbi:tape measure domain protein [uncultured phage]|nr:tape measure domain protein [uncultured phage]